MIAIVNDIPKSPGVYIIINMINGKAYIGQSINMNIRCRGHLNSLRNKVHKNKHLQAAWNKYGEDFFIFDSLEFGQISNLDIKENGWLGLLKTWDRYRGYNIERYARGTGPRSQEVCDNLREKLLGRKLSDLQKQKISNSLKNRDDLRENRRLAGLKSRKIKEAIHYV